MVENSKMKLKPVRGRENYIMDESIDAKQQSGILYFSDLTSPSPGTDSDNAGSTDDSYEHIQDSTYEGNFSQIAREASLVHLRDGYYKRRRPSHEMLPRSLKWTRIRMKVSNRKLTQK